MNDESIGVDNQIFVLIRTNKLQKSMRMELGSSKAFDHMIHYVYMHV